MQQLWLMFCSYRAGKQTMDCSSPIKPNNFSWGMILKCRSLFPSCVYSIFCSPQQHPPTLASRWSSSSLFSSPLLLFLPSGPFGRSFSFVIESFLFLIWSTSSSVCLSIADSVSYNLHTTAHPLNRGKDNWIFSVSCRTIFVWNRCFWIDWPPFLILE